VAHESPSGFSYEIEMSGEEKTVIKCHGRIVSETAGELKDLVKPMIPKVRHIIVDLSDVPFIDSSGLGALVGLKVTAGSAAYCTLDFVNFAPLVRDLLHTTKLSQFLGIS
jgi:anti-sigma B factor antagonist